MHVWSYRDGVRAHTRSCGPGRTLDRENTRFSKQGHVGNQESTQKNKETPVVKRKVATAWIDERREVSVCSVCDERRAVPHCEVFTSDEKDAVSKYERRACHTVLCNFYATLLENGRLKTS